MRKYFKEIMLETGINFGTPVYLYDSEQIREKYDDLSFGLPCYVDLYYSMKANPSLAICEYLRLLGANCEVSSQGEFHTAMRAGYKADQIIFVGPGKSYDEIEECLLNRIKLFVCESIDEIYLINDLSYKMGIKTNILIRINPDFIVKNSLIKMSGVPSQFGIDLKLINQHIDILRQLDNIAISGIQIYNASRVLDIAAITDNINQILHLAETLSTEWGIIFKTIDIGGGFGIPYFENEIEINSEMLTQNLTELFQQFRERHPMAKIIIELGRYLVAESGYLISKINYIKNNHDKNYLIIDAGMHCHMAAAGVGSFVQRNFPVEFVSQNMISDEKIKYQIAGPLCTPGDILLKDVLMPKANIGDFIVIKNSGAYGLTGSMTRFLSHGSPAEVFYYKNDLHLIRRRESSDDILATQFNLSEAIFNTGEY